MYIVNSPSLVASIERNRKTLQFGPLAAMFTTRIAHSSNRASQALMANVDLKKGDSSFYTETLREIHTALAGKGLEDMSKAMIGNISTSLDRLKSTEGAVRIKLWEWLLHEITLATSEAVYGPGNPLRDPKVEYGFWSVHRSENFN